MIKTAPAKSFLRDDIRIAVWGWIRTEAPVAMKMMFTPAIADELINVIEKRVDGNKTHEE